MTCKILVVEDEEERFNDTEEYLNKIGKDVEIVRALSVEGALRRLRARHFNLIILDISLGADPPAGHELLPDLMADPVLRVVPVICLSIHVNDQGVIDLCLRNGAKAFFHRLSNEFRDGFIPKVKELLEDCGYEK